MIDVHTHLWTWRETPALIADSMVERGYFGGKDPETFFNIDSLLAALAAGGVERAVVLPLRFEREGWIVSNAYIAQVVAQAPDRLIGFAGVSPLEEGADKELREAVEGLGLRGLKLHPPLQMFDPGDPRCFPIYEIMQHYGLPVLFHTGSGPAYLSDRYSNPYLVDEVAVNFPNLKIVLAHAGRFWYEDTLTMMRRHGRNIFIDISANTGKATGHGLLLALLTAVKEVIGDLKQVLFASDYPWYQPAFMLDLLRQAQAASQALPEPLIITDADMDDMLDGNTRRLLGLS
jgi:predicted TIM-barrel fold metal-dependent hydrolase